MLHTNSNSAPLTLSGNRYTKLIQTILRIIILSYESPLVYTAITKVTMGQKTGHLLVLSNHYSIIFPA